MKLVPVQPTEAGNTTMVLCCQCYVWGLVGVMLADLDGVPFQAYYHPDCAPTPRRRSKTAQPS